MVASPNAHDAIAPLVQRIDALERMIRELNSKNVYPVSVSPQGMDHLVVAPADPNNVGNGSANITIGAGDGTPMIRTQPNPYNNSKQTYYIYDPAGNVVMAPDTKAGYGLAEPSLSLPMYPYFAGYSEPSGSIGNANYQAWQCGLFIWTPRLFLSWISRCAGGGSASSWWQLIYGTTNTTTTTKTGGDGSSYSDSYTFTASDIGKSCQLILWVSNPANTGTTFVTPASVIAVGS